MYIHAANINPSYSRCVRVKPRMAEDKRNVIVYDIL